MNISYTRIGDYLLPDLKLEDFETTNDKYIFKNKN